MSSLLKEQYIPPEEYLASERRAETKSEYYDGTVYAMSGASPMHNVIVGNLITELNTQLRKTPYLVFPSDMKVRLPDSRKYFYPDLSVVCDTPVYADDQKDALLNPLIIVEVLSDSTSAYDRGKKFHAYQQIESLQEYLLVAQDRRSVDHYHRQTNESWVYVSARGDDGLVTLATVDCRLSFRDVYNKVAIEEIVDDGEEGELTA